MCVTLPLETRGQNGQSGGRVGFAAAPMARTTMRACLVPVEVWSVKSEAAGLYVMEVTEDFCTMFERSYRDTMESQYCLNSDWLGR